MTNNIRGWSKSIGTVDVVTEIETICRRLTMNSVTHNSVCKVSVVVSPHHRGSISNYGLCSSSCSIKTFSRYDNHHIPQISPPSDFFPFQNQIPIETNKVLRRGGNLRKCDETAARYPSKWVPEIRPSIDARFNVRLQNGVISKWHV